MEWVKAQEVIKLNCDLGEMELENLNEVLDLIDMANISCGAHAGTPELIETTVKKALAQGVTIGAHPSYPDKENFGRKTLNFSYEQLRSNLLAQISFLEDICQKYGGKLSYIKPHGALYNDMMNDLNLFQNVMKIFSGKSVMILNLPEMSRYQKMAKENNVQLLLEGFADRAYDSKGILKKREVEGAIFQDETLVLNQVRELLTKGEVHSICLHGDNPALMKCISKVNEILEISIDRNGLNGLKLIFHKTLDPKLLNRISFLANVIRKELPDLFQVIPAFNSIYIEFDLLRWNELELRQKCLDIILGRVVEEKPGKEIELPCYYLEDNDLELPVKELINLHSGTTYYSYAVGFLPGFSYLGEVPEQLRKFRLGNPRKRVPKGSVAIANKYTSVYPQSSPGGWNLIGLCPSNLYLDGSCLINMGDQVRFHSISKKEYLKLGGKFD